MTGTAVTHSPPVEGAITPGARRKFLEAFAGRLDKLTPEQTSAFLMALGQHIGVRAELGEVIIYQSKPYVTIDGRYRQAHHTGLLVGLEARPATPLERRNYGCIEGVALWVCDAYRRGASRAFRGWGEAGGKADKNAVAKEFPAKMAKKRARYDALRAAFPVGEDILPMHQGFIEDAERQADLGRIKVQPLAATVYTEAPDEVDEETGHDVAAIADRAAQGEDVYADPQDVVAQAHEKIRELLEHPNCAHMRGLVERGLKEGKYDSKRVALACVATLESLISPPESSTGDESAPADGSLGLNDKRPTRNAVEGGR